MFTLPFMCIDVIVDPSYYASLNNRHSSLSQYGTLVTLGPLAVFFLILIAVIHSRLQKRELKTRSSSSTLAQLVRINNTNLLAKNLLKKIGDIEPLNVPVYANSILINQNKKHSYVSNSRRFSRYELYEDCEPMATNDELLILELDTCVRKQTIPNEITTSNLLKSPSTIHEQPEFDEFYV